MQGIVGIAKSHLNAVFVSFLLIFSAFSAAPAQADDAEPAQFFVTDLSFVAGSDDDNIYVQWDSIGTDPIPVEDSD